MEPEVVKRLVELNREFYARFAEEFSETRGAARLDLAPFRPYLQDGLRVLDLGCGNGRLAEALDRAGLALDHVGLDASARLLEIARRKAALLRSVRADFVQADLASDGWSEAIARGSEFDLALALAVLHHLPGRERRRAFLAELHPLVPHGIVVLSNWQFERSQRLRAKVVPWQAAGLDASRVEPGDFLLNWKRGGTGYRYVHLITRDEIASLAAETGYAVVDQFEGEGGLNLYSVLRAAR